jgi:hypothetical protein
MAAALHPSRAAAGAWAALRRRVVRLWSCGPASLRSGARHCGQEPERAARSAAARAGSARGVFCAAHARRLQGPAARGGLSGGRGQARGASELARKPCTPCVGREKRRAVGVCPSRPGRSAENTLARRRRRRRRHTTSEKRARGKRRLAGSVDRSRFREEFVFRQEATHLRQRWGGERWTPKLLC